ncbi:uncharacterized protein LOC113322540 isoform X2 [Papaver somniferum]|uniref:uncharacterized protein LOC113322540 isoform X2 n=1 Tax=Papaver somniferum TaxID=3469 RepID=UPI000E6FF17D|nr:uncharacterized protein LOC113322540 isoform X2 [Papaver somniferum]
MAYRRKQGITRVSTFKEEILYPKPPPDDSNNININNSSSSSSLAAQAIRASSAHRDSSFSSAYGESALSSSAHKETARAKSFPTRQVQHTYRSPESGRKTESPSLQKGIEAITSSLNFIGGTVGNALEEGLTIVEHRTQDIIQEARKLHIKRKGNNPETQNHVTLTELSNSQQQLKMQTDRETQLKASRDVAMAMAAKAKLLLRELKTVKADLAFAKERCAQLEEENRILRESREKGDTPEDDDLIRLQLETLLAEKARLAHENSIYARENRFLREIVEYHQLTMQDVVYLDEGIEEVTEVHHFPSEPIDDTCSPSSSFISIPTPPPLPPASHTPHTVNKSSSPDSIVPSQPPVVKEIPVSSSPKNSDS